MMMHAAVDRSLEIPHLDKAGAERAPGFSPNMTGQADVAVLALSANRREVLGESP